MSTQNSGYKVNLNIESKFLYSTSGSQSSIEKHNEALKKLGLNLIYFTFPDEVSPETYTALLKSPIARGGAVTGKGGLKSTIIPFLDEVEPLAIKTLAVNTVVNNSGKLYGYNTDAFGLKTALVKGIEASAQKIKSAVIYGNGGVSGVAFHVLQELGIKVTMTGRNPELVLEKKKALGIASVEHFEGPYDLVVDATPISSNPDFLEAKGFADLLEGCKMVFCHNMPEKDNKTNHLQAYCNQKPIRFIPGKWMYAAQLIKQFQLYFEGYQHADGLSPITEKDIAEAWNLE
ncbi:shikimate dehydrogenase [Marivirga sp. S37H4]|uniref:Shikimate dehydrogenase n=1 Tax=Marivirga aurantiaca TaxID=2802615 RepID=A0A934WZH4_9BACT|nr:shikimate dehydrogenase [Marivirga aurantiaca]MBK6266069.1 shikimate dehydrogenase [Marivirga aurantiaca]